MTKRLALGLCLLPCLALASDSPGDRTPSFRRALNRAVERAQEQLEKRIVVYEDHSTWDNAWRIESTNYVVTTTVSRAFGQRLAKELETMLYEFKKLLRSDFVPDKPFEIFVFPDIDAYNEFGNNNGAEHSSFYGSFYAQQHSSQPVAACYSDNWTLMGMQATHSAFHQFLDQAYSSQPPTWIAEGLASYFELYWDKDYYVTEFEKLVAEDEFLPLGRLLIASLQQYTSNTHERLIELGMFFNYMLNHRPDTRSRIEDGKMVQPFADFVREMVTGGSAAGGELPSGGLPDIEKGFKEFDFRE